MPVRRPHRGLQFQQLETRSLLAGVISGFVYTDLDADGARDAGEVGIPGVRVRLTGTPTGAEAIDLATLTDDDGEFVFEDVAPGSYQLAQRQAVAVMDGIDSTTLAAAVVTNDQIANLVLAQDQVLAANNFGERGVHPEFVTIRWFLASSPTLPAKLREAVALGEELAGNTELAASIRAGASTAPEIEEEDDDDDNNNNTPPADNNVPFLAVTTGAFDSPNLLGIRTDLVSGAPPITQTHVDTAIDYTGYSNPPTYGPHHAMIMEGSNNITPRPTGVYSTEQPDEDLVHNLEHGHVWISYHPGLLSATDKARLEAFVIAGGQNTGVILTPRVSNTSVIAVASWAHLLTMDTLDLTAIRNFVNTNRGHAPEGFLPSGQKPASGGETLDDGLPHSLANN